MCIPPCLCHAHLQVTKDVIHEFATDNVKYIELRTTPRAVRSTGMTKESHIAAVVVAIKESSDDIIVRLLLAIDRKTTLEDAWDTLEMVDRLRSGGIVVGLDLSGNPTVLPQLHNYLLAFLHCFPRSLLRNFSLCCWKLRKEE
jgi:adenosine deaminase